MTTTIIDIDRVAVAPLIKKYGKTKFYTQYLPALQIKPQREGNYSYLTPEEAHAIEQYHAARGQGQLAAKAFLSEYLQSRSELPIERSEPLYGRSELPLERSELLPTESTAPLQIRHFWLLVEAIASRLQPPLSDPLELNRQLAEIAEENWEVSTSQLRQILGRNPTEGERYGFRLIKLGRSCGRESGWRVERKS